MTSLGTATNITPGKNDNMAAMTLAVGMVYREIYSWKAAILYRRFICQGTPLFIALEKTEESVRAAYTSGKASMLAMVDVVEIHTPQPATDNSFPSSTMLRKGGMTCPNMRAFTYSGHTSSEDSSLFLSLTESKDLADGLATPLHL